VTDRYAEKILPSRHSKERLIQTCDVIGTAFGLRGGEEVSDTVFAHEYQWNAVRRYQSVKSMSVLPTYLARIIQRRANWLFCLLFSLPHDLDNPLIVGTWGLGAQFCGTGHYDGPYLSP
jgi:hypothetical protein